MGFFEPMIRRLKGRHDFTIFNMIGGDKKKIQNHHHMDAAGPNTKKKTKTRNISPVSSAEKKPQIKKPQFSDHLVLVRLPLGFFVIRDSIFIDSCLVHRIQPKGMVQRAQG